MISSKKDRRRKSAATAGREAKDRDNLRLPDTKSGNETGQSG